MNRFLLLPICTGAVLALHAWLRLTGRKQSKCTFWLLLAGLPALTVASFISAARTEQPDPSRLASGPVSDGGMGAFMFSFESFLLWFVVGFATLVLSEFAPNLTKS
jgi:hypothetical protein